MSVIISLTDRALLGLKGKDVEEFLQGTITQDIRKLESEKGLYAAHLTAQGRFLFDFFIFKKNDLIILDCNKSELMNIAKSLHGYVLGKDVEFHDVSEDYAVYADLKGKFEDQNVISFTDPRLKSMGTRIIAPADFKMETHSNLEEYNKQRIKLGVVDGSVDGLKSRTLANELSLDFLNGVSFEKGCYVGQELTARTKHRTEAKKRVFQISFNGENVERETHILKGTQEAGWIFSQYSENGQTYGIAILRTRYIESDLTLNGQIINIQKPKWAGY